MKVHALDDDANDVYSELITINQEGYVAPATPGKWVETTLASLTSSDVFVIVGDNGENYALSNDKGASSAPTAVKVDVEGNTLKSEPENNVKWTIDFTENGFVFYPYGSTETWLYCTNANNGVRVGTNDNKEFTTEEGYLKNTETSRFVGVYISQDWRCYTINTGNIANQTFKFYKRIDADKVQTISVTDAGYATLVAKEDLEVPAGIEVFAVQVKGIYAHLEPVTAGVPAGEAVIVKAVAEGDYSLPYAEDAVNAINGNELKASDEPIEADGTQYILAKPENEEVGFYPAATGTTIAAGKAYLQITGTASVKGFTFSFDSSKQIVVLTGTPTQTGNYQFLFKMTTTDGESLTHLLTVHVSDQTGIKTLEDNCHPGQTVYDVQGRCRRQMKTGLNIIRECGKTRKIIY